MSTRVVAEVERRVGRGKRFPLSCVIVGGGARGTDESGFDI